MARHTRQQAIDEILDAAISCVLALGVDNVQVAQIAAKAGISTRTLHRYYPYKAALLSDAAAKHLWGVYTSFADAYDGMDKDGKTGLHAPAGAIYCSLASNPKRPLKRGHLFPCVKSKTI